MCGVNQDFYYWDDGSGLEFRKLVLKISNDFITELERFNKWKGNYKQCRYCYRNFPGSEYFFRSHPQNRDGLLNKCKECEGNKFTWGNKKKNELKLKHEQYCTGCDTIYPCNDIYFCKNKHSSSGCSRYCKKCSPSPTEFGITRFLNAIIKHKEGHQICYSCMFELPKIEEYYFKSDKENNVYETICKLCQGVEYGVTKINYTYSYLINDNQKMCSDCNQIFDMEEFYFKDKKSNRRYSRCKTCHYIYHRKRRESLNSTDYSNNEWEIAKEFWTDTDGYVHCAYCDDITDDPTMEHVIPFSKGGQFKIDNIIPVCKSCNCSKCNRTLDGFFVYSDKFTQELYEKVIEYIEFYS